MAGLDDLYAADTLKAATLAGALPPDVATVKRSTWVDSVPNAMDAAVRGVIGGAAKVGAAALEFAGQMEAGQERAIRQRGEREPGDMSRRFGLMAESVRDVERSLRPDPITAGAAENVVYGLSSVLSQAIPASIVGGPMAGAAVVGAGEGAAATDDLQRAKVDDATAAKAGLLTGGAAALGVVLPVAGSTLLRTGALYLAGGPGAFMAQQAATREILERANYADLAKQYDPLDPTGLALSSLFPLPFAAHGALRNIAASEKPAPKGEHKPVAGDRAPGAPMADEPPARTSTSDDVDAALVHNLTLQQDAHEAAMAALTDVPPEAGLTHAERVIEDRFRAQVHGDPEAALAAYAKLPDTAGGKIVNTDEARELSSDFAASRDSRALLARAVHGPASWVAKLQWRHLLAKPPETGEVLILGGGGGSGKTSSLKQIAPGFTDRYDAIFDTTLSKERTAIQAIEQALASGRRVTINFTARDPFESIVNGIIPRAEKKGRTVPLGIAAEAHTEAPKVLLALEAKYADDDRVRFQLVDNTGGPGAARIVGLGDYPQFDYNGLAERAVEAAREAYVKGDIGEPVYRGLVGEGESQASARSGEGESRPRNADVGGQPEPQRAPGGAGAGRGPQEGRTGAEELTPPPDSGGEQSLSPSALGDAHMRSVADRVASVERENPAAAQEMAAARELAAEGDDVNLGALDADLLQVAANCALSLGGA